MLDPARNTRFGHMLRLDPLCSVRVMIFFHQGVISKYWTPMCPVFQLFLYESLNSLENLICSCHSFKSNAQCVCGILGQENENVFLIFGYLLKMKIT